MRKSAFCICEKKADQLRGNRTADQCLCFRYIDGAIPFLLNSEISSLLTLSSDCTARFVSDLVENPTDRFSGDAAHQLPGNKSI